MGYLLEGSVVPACRGAGFWVLHDAEQEVTVLPIQLNDALVMLLVRDDDTRREVQFSMPRLFSVPSSKREAMAMAIGRWNFEHLPMLLVIDPADGEVRAALVVDVQMVTDVERTLAANLTHMVSASDQAYPSLARLRWASDGRRRRTAAGEVERQVAEILRRAGELPEP